MAPEVERGEVEALPAVEFERVRWLVMMLPEAGRYLDVEGDVW